MVEQNTDTLPSPAYTAKSLPRRQGGGKFPPVPSNPQSIMLRQLADSLERQDRLESQQVQLAERLDVVAEKVRDLDGDTGYVTVLAYGRLKGIDMPRNKAQRHGKDLTAIHKRREIPIGKAPDERHGQVNTYRIDVVEEYFSDTLPESGQRL
jgi:hypothetical protein